MEYVLSPAQCWLLFGFITMILEIFFLSGFGMLFVSLGALSVAGIISIYPSLLSYEYPIFAISGFIWFGILWKPLKKYLHSKADTSHSSDLIGQSVEVAGYPLLPGAKLGQVKWSGTILNAKLDQEIIQQQPIGTTLLIKEVEGSIVICTKLGAENV